MEDQQLFDFAKIMSEQQRNELIADVAASFTAHLSSYLQPQTEMKLCK